MMGRLFGQALPIVLTGGGIWISARLIPGQWVAIVLFGAALAGVSAMVPAALASKPLSDQLRQPHLIVDLKPSFFYGLSAFLAAAGIAMLWMTLASESAVRIPVPLASMSAFLAGALFGLSLFLSLSAQRLAGPMR